MLAGNGHTSTAQRAQSSIRQQRSLLLSGPSLTIPSSRAAQGTPGPVGPSRLAVTAEYRYTQAPRLADCCHGSARMLLRRANGLLLYFRKAPYPRLCLPTLGKAAMVNSPSGLPVALSTGRLEGIGVRGPLTCCVQGRRQRRWRRGLLHWLCVGRSHFRSIGIRVRTSGTSSQPRPLELQAPSMVAASPGLIVSMPMLDVRLA